MTKPTKRKAVKMWGVFRDGAPYQVHDQEGIAADRLSVYAPGSKHKWRIAPVTVSWTLPKPKKKARKT